MAIFLICSNLLIFLLRSYQLPCLLAVFSELAPQSQQQKVTKKSSKPSSLRKLSFCFFYVFPVQPPQKWQVPAKILTIRHVFPDYSFISYYYDWMKQTIKALDKSLFLNNLALKLIFLHSTCLFLFFTDFKSAWYPSKISSNMQ